MPQPAFIRVCPQRHNNDCAVCCFVMLCGISYEAALVAIGQVDQKLATNGLYFTQLKQAAAQLGIKLATLRKGRYDFQNDVGILSIKHPDKTEHAVVLFRGTIIDPEEGVIWDDVEAFIETEEVKLGGLLVVVADRREP